MKKILLTVLSAVLLAAACDPNALKPVEYGTTTTQVSIDKVAKWPYMSDTYKLIDWKLMAVNYDRFVYNRTATGEYLPLIWTDKQHNNIGFDGFGLYTAMGDSRQGPKAPGGHEAINVIASVMGAGLVGIDKTNQDGYNYARMCQQYYARNNGWHIMVNNTVGFAGDWWYNTLPNLLYLGVCDVFPGVEGADEILLEIASQFKKAEDAMEGNYDWSYFNFGQMRGIKNNLPKQQDAAGGHGYILLNSFRKFGNPEFLEAAKSAITVLNNQKESRFYEIVLPFGAYTAAVLNATQGTSYDVKKMLDWTFDGNLSDGRYGWAVTQGKWGPYDVYGLQGSVTDGGGYAFLMNSLEMPWPIVPIVKYAPEFCNTVGKWMYHLASACRLFYPYHIDDEHQYAPDLKRHTGGVIGYEGLRKKDRYNTFPGVTPIAEGDGMSWSSKNTEITVFSLYSSSPVGIMGSIVSATDVPGIIRLDCNVTDFYAERAYPENLYYNPYSQEKIVSYVPEHQTYGNLNYSASESYDLFDVLTRTYVAKDCHGSQAVSIGAQNSLLLVELPAGTKLYQDGSRIVDSQRRVIAW